MGGRSCSHQVFEGQDLSQQFIRSLECRNSTGQEGEGARLRSVLCTSQHPTPVLSSSCRALSTPTLGSHSPPEDFPASAIFQTMPRAVR